MKYKYFVKYLETRELETELEAFGKDGWRLIHIEHHEQSPNWLAIFIKEVKDDI